MKNFKWKSEYFFILVLFVFTSVVIFLLLRYQNNYFSYVSTNSKNVTMDAISSIMNASDSAMNKINNIIVITTVYITVIVATFSLFQYIKSKEMENIKKELQDNINELKGMLEKDRSRLNDDVKVKIQQMKSILDEVKKENLNISNSTRIDLLEMKAEMERSKNNNWNDSNAIKAYKEIFHILEQYPDLIDVRRKVELYHHYAMINTLDANEAELYYDKAIEENNYDDNLKSYSYSNLGLIKLNNKYYNKAIDLFEKSLLLDENNLFNQMNLIMALDKRNNEDDIEKAIKILKNLRGYNKYEEGKSFLRLINELKIPNIQNKYKDEIDKLKNQYVHDDPGLASCNWFEAS